MPWELSVTFQSKDGTKSMTVRERHERDAPTMELSEIQTAVDRFNGFFADAKLSVSLEDLQRKWKKLDWFVPHGSRCQADHGMPDCVVECGKSATSYVQLDDGRVKLVCPHHLGNLALHDSLEC